MAYCAKCGSQLADTDTVCQNCGAAAGAAPGAAGARPASTGAAPGGLTDNAAGMLAYVTFIPAIIFLAMEPYNRSRFVRFHSFQSIFFAVAWTVLWIVLSVLGMIPVLGWATLFLWPVLALAGLAIWVLLLIKANQGQMWKLPVIGDLAEKQAG